MPKDLIGGAFALPATERDIVAYEDKTSANFSPEEDPVGTRDTSVYRFLYAVAGVSQGLWKDYFDIIRGPDSRQDAAAAGRHIHILGR